jgi:hypothetical protein
MHKPAPSGVSTGKNPTELDLVIGEAMQSVPNIQSTFLDMSCSTTAGHLPHSMLEFCYAETTTPASQLEAHLQAAWVEHFPGNHDITEQSACWIAARGSQQGPWKLQPKC